MLSRATLASLLLLLFFLCLLSAPPSHPIFPPFQPQVWLVELAFVKLLTLDAGRRQCVGWPPIQYRRLRYFFSFFSCPPVAPWPTMAHGGLGTRAETFTAKA